MSALGANGLSNISYETSMPLLDYYFGRSAASVFQGNFTSAGKNFISGEKLNYTSYRMKLLITVVIL